MPGPDATDEQLLLARDAASFELFYVRHVDAVLGFFARRTRDAELAADLCAETFAAALASRHRFRPGPAPATAWLFGIGVEEAGRRPAPRLRRACARGGGSGMERIELSDAGHRAHRATRRRRRGARADGAPARRSSAPRSPRTWSTSVRTARSRASCETSEAVVRKRVSRGLATMRTRMGAASMNQDFVDRAAAPAARGRAARGAPRAGRAARRARAPRPPGPAPLAAALAVALLALAVAVGALALRGEPEPTAPKVVRQLPRRRRADLDGAGLRRRVGDRPLERQRAAHRSEDPEGRGQHPGRGRRRGGRARRPPPAPGGRRRRLRRGVGAGRRSRERRPPRRGATPAHRPAPEPRRRSGSR